MLLPARLYPGIAQTKFVESLKQQIQTSAAPDIRLQLILQLCEQRESLPADTLYTYALFAKRLATSLKDKESETLAGYYIAASLQSKGSPDSAVRLAEHYLRQLHPEQYDLRQKFTYLRATSLIRGNQYHEAIGIAYKMLEEAEDHTDTLMQMVARNTIGWACMEMNNYHEALVSLRQAYVSGNGHEKYEKAFGIACSNLAAVYNSLRQYDSAEYFINKSITAARHTEGLDKLANALNIQADGYMLTGRRGLAEAPLKEALSIRQSIGDPYYIVSDMYQLALFYAGSGQAAKGIRLSREGISLARQYRLNAKLPILYEALAESYKAAGDMAAYGKTLEQLMSVKDSVYQGNTAEALAGLQAKYEVAKQENIIIRQKLALIRQNYLIYGALLLLLFAIVLSLVLFRSYHRKQRLRMQHMMQEEKQTAAAAVRVAEEAERKRIAADLHDNLGAYAASIASNIDHIHADSHGKDIAAMHELRTNSREMVSQLNDTIWVLKKDALSITAISDRIKPFIQRLGASHPELSIEVQEDIIADRLLSPVQAFHLFRMMQEAIANAVKHSGGNEITLTIKSTEDDLNIRIQDNGRGMNGTAGSAPEGNGLYNMQARAEAGNWVVEWLPRQPSGTIVSIQPATTN